ncbi:uncharacterized protein [Palaemon carinicauda]|uniref:uncharacterized protein n=1 Tax=Palaemon carinicauda TaxID=392227 RepID=UPI0035B58A26
MYIELEAQKLTYVGTLRDKKQQVPGLMTDKTVIKIGCAAFLFDTTMTIVSHLPDKKKKFVQLITSMHQQPVIDDCGKPKIILYDINTKGGVYTFDQMCALYTYSRKTKQWPLCIMYGLLNAASVNSYAICNEMRKHDGQAELLRRK